MLPAQPNQSLLDGLACLQALAAATRPVGTRELARQLGLDTTRVNRLLKTLAAVGLAEQDAKRKYRPGPAIHVLTAQVLHGSGLLGRAVPVLEGLHKHGYIVAMGVLWRDQGCYLYHSRTGHSVGEGLRPHGNYPAESSGLGAALLAHQPEDAVRALYAHREDVDLPHLLDQLARYRADGYALVSSLTIRNRTIGVTVGSPPYAALGISGTFPDSEVPELVDSLLAAAKAVDSTDPGGI